jgi:hypothetical protein
MAREATLHLRLTESTNQNEPRWANLSLRPPETLVLGLILDPTVVYAGTVAAFAVWLLVLGNRRG